MNRTPLVKAWVIPEFLHLLWCMTVPQLRALCKAAYGYHLPRVFRKADLIRSLQNHDGWVDGLEFRFYIKRTKI